MNFQKGDVVEARVINLKPYGAFCRVGDIIGLIHISEFSDFFVKSIDKFVKLGDIIKVEVLSYNPEKNQLKLSYKKIRPELKKKSDYRIKETRRGFSSLQKEHVDKQHSTAPEPQVSVESKGRID